MTLTTTNPAAESAAGDLYRELRARGIVFALAGTRLRVMPWTRLSEEERAAVRALRHELKELALRPPPPPKRSDAPSPPPPPEPDHAGLGLYRKNGIWTHTLGDEHAARILSGEIPLDKALADERARQRYLANLTSRRR